jgi:hypothetical protein
MAHHHFDWHSSFLAALRELPVVAHACKAVGIERSTAYRAREADEGFAKAWDDAMEEGIDRAEQEAFRRAVVGFEEPVIDKGRLAYRYERYEAEDGSEHYRVMLDANGQPVPLTTRKHSDALLAMYLKGRRKKVYADRTELTGAEGGDLKVVDDTAKAARVAQLMALAQARKAEADEFGDLA